MPRSASGYVAETELTAKIRAVPELYHPRVKCHAARGITQGTSAPTQLTEHFILMCNSSEPTTSRVWSCCGPTTSRVRSCHGAQRWFMLCWWCWVTCLVCAGPFSVPSTTLMETHNSQEEHAAASSKAWKWRIVSQKGWVDPLIGFGFKNRMDAIHVFCLDGNPKILIQAISKRICGIWCQLPSRVCTQCQDVLSTQQQLCHRCLHCALLTYGQANRNQTIAGFNSALTGMRTDWRDRNI